MTAQTRHGNTQRREGNRRDRRKPKLPELTFQALFLVPTYPWPPAALQHVQTTPMRLELWRKHYLSCSLSCTVYRNLVEKQEGRGRTRKAGGGALSKRQSGALGGRVVERSSVRSLPYLSDPPPSALRLCTCSHHLVSHLPLEHSHLSSQFLSLHPDRKHYEDLLGESLRPM